MKLARAVSARFTLTHMKLHSAMSRGSAFRRRQGGCR
jgi:hypothetical protein